MLRGAWPAEPVGMAQPARPRRLARTPPERVAGSPERHAAGPYCSAVASSRSLLWPPVVVTMVQTAVQKLLSFWTAPSLVAPSPCLRNDPPAGAVGSAPNCHQTM